MKKLFAILALAFAGSAFAQGYGAIEYETAETRDTKADSYSTGVILGFKDGNWQYSGRLNSSQAEWGNGSISTSYEARVKRSFSIYGANPYLQGRLGEQVTSSSNFGYYAVDAGVVVPVVKKFDLDFSYRYRNAFNTANNFQTNRYGIEGKYSITAKDTLGLRYTQSYGDSDTNAWRLQYAHSF